MTATTQRAGVVEALVVAPNNVYIIRNPLVAVRKGLRAAAVVLKVSAPFKC
jgi:hypothetical protein